MKELLFKIVRLALWGQPSEVCLHAEGFIRLLEIAEQQSVFGLVFDALKDLQVDGMEDKMPLFEAVGFYEQIKQQNGLSNKEIVNFVKLCDKNKLENIIVKGQTLEAIYPKRGVRQSGDIDFVIKRSQYNQFASVLGIELPKKLTEKEFEFERNSLSYELHTDLIAFARKRHKKVWNELMEKEWAQEHYVEIEGVNVRTLTPTVNAVYIFIHLFFHFIREGVSLRQMCDWVMALHHYKDEIDSERLKQILLDLDVFDAYCAFGTILVDKLGLPLKEFPVPINDKDRKWQERILDDIFRGGNFGMLNHEAKSSWKYKVETFCVALRNSFKYYMLCPTEVGGIIPRLVKVNLKILLKS